MTFVLDAEPAPQVTLRDETNFDFPSHVAGEQLKLEGRIAIPSGARRIVVLAHPHPRFGGTMHNAIVLAIAKTAQEHGAATLRFNYRGVEGSQGSFDGGRGESDDVISAIKAARLAMPDAPVTLVGYSFGAWTSLHAAVARVEGARVDRLALVAPAATLFDFRSIGGDWERPTAIVIGEHDEVCSIPQAKKIARHLDASLTVVAGETHFFYRGRRRMAEKLAPFLLAEGVLLTASMQA